MARAWKCLAVLTAFVGAAALFATAVSAVDKSKTAPSAAVATQARLPNKVMMACADPAAAEIKFVVISRDPVVRTKGLVRITGVVKNIGPRTSANVFFIQLSTPAGQLASQTVPSLAPGAVAQVMKDMNWDSASPNEGEFPPKFTLTLVRDPDTPIDDCNVNNNTLERNGADINTLLKS